MKKKNLTLLSAFPFCIPFAFIFFAVSYYLGDEWSWLSIAAAALLGALSFTYASLGKEKEMLICNKVGMVISIIINCIIWNSIDQISFFETYGLTLSQYFRLMWLIELGIPLFAIITEKIIKKIKIKIKKQKFFKEH